VIEIDFFISLVFVVFVSLRQAQAGPISQFVVTVHRQTCLADERNNKQMEGKDKYVIMTIVS